MKKFITKKIALLAKDLYDWLIGKNYSQNFIMYDVIIKLLSLTNVTIIFMWGGI